MGFFLRMAGALISGFVCIIFNNVSAILGSITITCEDKSSTVIPLTLTLVRNSRVFALSSSAPSHLATTGNVFFLRWTTGFGLAPPAPARTTGEVSAVLIAIVLMDDIIR